MSAKAAAVWVPISDLKPWVGNPRINDHAVPAIMSSIVRFGWSSPLVVREKDHEVVAGHTRLKAALALPAAWEKATRDERKAWHPEAVALATNKSPEVPVRFKDLTEAEAHALALADNKLGELSLWDEEAVAKALEGIKGLDDALVAMTGFSEFEAQLLAGIAPTPGEDRTKGDVDLTNDTTSMIKLRVPMLSADKAREAITSALKSAGVEFELA